MPILSRQQRVVLLISALTTAAAAAGLKTRLSGQASAWLGAGYRPFIVGQAGLRYIPTLSFSLPLRLDGEASANGYASASSRDDSSDFAAAVKPYRLWLRYSTARLEARAGLQKINFGSATLLRPLQWFARIDPRDPLQLTDGVYGLLVRYYFQNNSNIWAWGLVGNSSPKGWERIGSVRWKPEFGARVQAPLPRGEVAATYHHRTIDYSGIMLVPEMLPEQAEDRLGLDAKFDAGIGICVEGALVHEQHRMDYGMEPAIWTRMATAGVDYTLGIGPGLGLAAEHMLAGTARTPFGSEGEVNLSAMMLGLPFGLLDNLKAIFYYDWAGRGFYRFVGWQRTLDNWVFSVTAFWNPDYAPAVLPNSATAATGKGVQLMVVYNH